ncbi:hypothetical protein CT676_38165 [Bradyrhizobium sp. MOS001]|uniref:hypothetical protein n=1 Tax=unclassified Bradyrhizobium TaxID=2631580 RepID=UPI0010751874|nr:hypothetical protein [Bradyrhizobium sp. MOS001]TFW55890.1 hypothetical protein CT676_38165 [Bradyrhizobium sp. MOS001]
MARYPDVQRFAYTERKDGEASSFRGEEVVFTNSLPATCVHPFAIAIALVGTAYTVLTFWVAFAGGEASAVLTMVSLILMMMLGLMTGCGYSSRNMEPYRAATRSFRDFIEGDVDLQSGRISGRASLCQLATVTGGIALATTSMLAVFVAIAPAYPH